MPYRENIPNNTFNVSVYDYDAYRALAAKLPSFTIAKNIYIVMVGSLGKQFLCMYVCIDVFSIFYVCMQDFSTRKVQSGSIAIFTDTMHVLCTSCKLTICFYLHPMSAYRSCVVYMAPLTQPLVDRRY